MEADRLLAAVAAAETERARWARELHDDTLQTFGALRLQLAGVLHRGETGRYESAIRDAVKELKDGIEGLRAIISDLRPSALDDLGLKPALEALLERRRRDGLKITAELELPDRQTRDAAPDPDLDTAIYRIVQEALTNVVKHAHASTVRVAVRAADAHITVDVQDDGVGFDPNRRTAGFGLAGMSERVHIAGGALELDSNQHGTRIHVSLPARNASHGEASTAAS